MTFAAAHAFVAPAAHPAPFNPAAPFGHSAPSGHAVAGRRVQPLDMLAVAAQTDPRQLTEFLTALRKRLLPLVRSAVARLGKGALVAADVDDMLQDLLVAAWQQDLPRYDPTRGSFLTFAEKRLRWRVVDLARSVSRRHADSLDAPAPANDDGHGEVQPALVAPEMDPETLHLQKRAAARAQHSIARLHLALVSLPRAHAEIVVRCDLKGEPQRAVAHDLGIHISNVSRARAKALGTLRTELSALAA